MAHVAIIGAGWAGLTAAITLQQQGHQITLYERSPATLGGGGRASTAYAHGSTPPFCNTPINFGIDNGQHVLLGAYTDTLTLFKTLNINIETAFLRLPAAWHMPNHLSFAVSSDTLSKTVFKQLPLTYALLKGILKTKPMFKDCVQSVLFFIRLMCACSYFNKVYNTGYYPRYNETVKDWLLRLKAPLLLIESLWNPLCFATMNTPPEIACAIVFQRIIKEGLLSGTNAAAMLVPRGDLGALFPKIALHYLKNNGAILHLGTAVESIQCINIKNNQPLYHIHTVQSKNAKGISIDYHAVICATTAKDAVRILPSECLNAALLTLSQQRPEPITTIHLKLIVPHNNQNTSEIHGYLSNAVIILPEPNLITDDKNNLIKHAVVIDRGYLDSNQTGWITLVLSSSHQALHHSHQVLAHAAFERLKTVFDVFKLHNINYDKHNSIVIHSKHATFSCVANLERPKPTTPYPNLVLAGDYVASNPYSATLEGAVKTGLYATTLLTV